MARPSKAAEAELQRLEDMAALLIAIVDSSSVLELRLEQADLYLKQAERRARGQPHLAAALDRLRTVVEPAPGELETMIANVGEIQNLLTTVLKDRQGQRTRQNNGDGA